MDLNAVTRSLPPLVEGKIHGYLKLVISQVIWHRTRQGDVTVVASWWGETDSASFRPVDPTMDSTRAAIETGETYAIRTNFDLFEEYLTNCGAVDLIIISEPLNEIIGTAQISDLHEIFRGKPYIQYCSIFNKVGTKIGDIPVHLTLSKHQKNQKSPRKLKEKKSTTHQNMTLINEKEFPNQEEAIYRSILKDKRFNMNRNIQKTNPNVTDKLVAQVVARAQKLRGVLIKETRADDLLEMSENSLDSFRTENDPTNEPDSALYKYFMGTSMTRKDEKKALEKLRLTSPTASLIDFATETIISCRDDKTCDQFSYSRRNTSELSSERLNEEREISNCLTIQQKEAEPLDHVDSLRIVIESLTLTPAGYRRVKSSCLNRTDGIPTSVTYFVQYDAAFANVKKYNKKVINEGTKPVKITSRKQDGQVVHFNHEAIYNLPKSHLHLHINMPLRFKIFNRHLEQRSPTELGIGSVHIEDAAKSPNLSSTQKLAIVKKGIKIGELKVTIELGCDRIHFGKQFIEALTMAKENIPVLELSNGSISLNRYKCTTGNESRPSSNNTGVTSVPDQRQCTSRHEGTENSMTSRREISRKTEERVKIDIPRIPEEKTLLHGLIYIAEGKNLPAMNTYIVCRALWRQDKSSSRICTDTTNPYYNFHQIMPLIYGLELLERTKDNCIITEVYSKNSTGEDNLIGISKLSVHQLYVAFRDPLVLPNLLKSRYPVISVDGWVPITDPVTGRPCGELSALVALGTADQIALLEMTRGLRGVRNSPLSSRSNTGLHHEHRESSVRTQECQTEITTVSDVKSADSRWRTSEELRGEQTAVLHTIVDKLAQALTAPRIITSQEAQTEFQVPTRESDILKMENNSNPQVLSLNPSNSNSFSGDDFNDSPRDNFEITREIYRSVGVGAEFNEPAAQNNQTVSVNNYNLAVDEKLDHPSSSKNNVSPLLKVHQVADDDSEDEGFRAVIEIECALHLPTVDLPSGSIEPSTYVTFQKLPGSQDEMTDICPYSCNPRYDWRCDTKLSTDLLTNDKMRLIMKVWRLLDAEVDSTINPDKDIVIGFSAVDLSVLAAGFPIVSGWFHINDFSGKCNGQLKVCVTPLDNISSFSKSGGTLRSQVPLDHSNFSSPYPEDVEKMTGVNNIQTCSETLKESQIPADGVFDIALGLGDASMSFLSSSLKQKLTELDEIKQRLQSRLLDVTSTAFEDDFDNDFDFIEGEIDPEDDYNNGNNVDINSTRRLAPSVENNSPVNGLSQVNNRITNGNGEIIGEIESNQYHQRSTSDNNPNSLEANFTDTGYSSSSNAHPIVPITNGHSRAVEPRVFEMPDENINPASNGPHGHQSYPARGTRMHISHLLDKLSMQLTTAPAPISNLPMKRNIMDLISSLRRNNNNFSNDIKCNRQANVRTVPTQTDANFISNSPANNSETKVESKRNNSSFSNEDAFKEDEIPAKTQKREKVSTIVREELINDDQNDSSDYDDLSAHLITSNIRHMDANNMLNPLLYRHALPDISILPELPEVQVIGQESTSPSLTPDDDTLERLDSRYSESFSATINKSLGRLRNFLEGESTSSHVPQLSPTTESTELFRVTPTGVPDNTDGNIDVTVIHKPCNDELMASNSIESTATVSIDNTMQTITEIDDNSSLNSVSSVSAVSRQAPDGGNTVEDPSKPILLKRRENLEDSSAGS